MAAPELPRNVVPLASGPVPTPPPGRFDDYDPAPITSIGTIGLADIALPLPPIPWVCHGLRIAPGAPTIVAGYGFSGKTVALQSLALAVATGRDAWGTWSTRRCPVLHVDYEQGRYLTIDRYQRLARGMGVELGAEPSDALRLAVMPPIWLDEPRARDAWARILDGYGVSLIDSLRAAAPSLDENGSEIRRALDAMTWASEQTGCACLVTHHARKPSEDKGAGSDAAKFSIRGSSGIFDAAGNAFVFGAAKGEPIRVMHEKERYTGRLLDPFGISIEDTADGGLVVTHLEPEQVATAVATTRGTRAVADLAQTKALALAAIRAGRFRSANAVREAIGKRRELVLAAIGELKADGAVWDDDGILRVLV